MRGAGLLLVWLLGGCQVVFKLQDSPVGDAPADTLADAREPKTFAGLVARYSMDGIEPDGTVVDSGPHGIHASCVACPAPRTDGAFAGALTFDGVNDIIDIPPHPMLETSEGFTIAAWVNLDRALDSGAQSFGCVAAKLTGNNTTWAMSQRGIDQLLVMTVQTSASTIEFVFSVDMYDLVGAWHHLVMRWDGETGRHGFGVDGVIDRDVVTGLTHFFDGSGATLGAQIIGGAPSCYWPGALDEIQLYDHALDNTQISVLFDDRMR